MKYKIVKTPGYYELENGEVQLYSRFCAPEHHSEWVYVTYVPSKIEYTALQIVSVTYSPSFDDSQQLEFDFSSEGSILTTTNTPTSTPKYCNHEWKTYHGLNHVDEYCVKCMEKRNV